MRYFIVALVVSLCWAHQDWLFWPLLSEVQKEHDLLSGIPAGLGLQGALSFATAAVWFLAVWKAWPTELESWASASDSRRGNRNRSRRGRGRKPQGENRPANERTGKDGNRPRRRRGGRGRRGGGNPNSHSRSQ